MTAKQLRRVVSGCICAGLCLVSTAGSAGLFRAYLSLNGNDANACTLPAPCRLLPAALVAVNDGGEIWMLDSANFNTGPVLIAKSVKILAVPGALGSVVGNGGDAIVINTTGDVTLRNLVILNLNGGVNGVTIQNAGAVHIEKTSIDGFNTDTSSCIQLVTANTVRLYIVDTFLRHCRNSIYANGTATPSNRTSVIVDNTRIERGFGAPTVSYGLWMQGCIDVSLRNSMISRQDVGIQVDSLLGSCVSHLQVINSEVSRSNTCLQVVNTTASATGQIAITGSQFSGCTDSMKVSNTAVAGNLEVALVDSHVSFAGNGGVQISNSAADANTSRIQMDMVRSEITDTTNVAVDLSATNGGRAYLIARDSTIAFSGTLVRTAGTSTIGVSLIRSNLHRATIGIDHGAGTIRIDASHVVQMSNDFVNNGSGTIVSLGNNMIYNVDNASGLNYITPTIIAGK